MVGVKLEDVAPAITAQPLLNVALASATAVWHAYQAFV
jgi:hypothetical protein